MHPTTRLVVWFSLVVAGQLLADRFVLAILLLLPAFGSPVRQDWQRLAWSARWLIVSLFVVLSWGGAGEPAWHGPLAPAREGLASALSQIARLLLVLMAVAVLRRWLPLPDLLRGLHGLLRPVRRCGVDTDRLLVRLILVLRRVDQLPPSLREWRSLLEQRDCVGGEVIELVDSPLSCIDYLTIPLVTGLVAAFCLQRS